MSNFHKNTLFVPSCIFLSALIILSQGCIKDKFDDLQATYSGTLAFPVAAVEFSLDELLDEDTLFTTGTDNSVRLVYRKEGIFSLSANDIFEELIGSSNQTFQKQLEIGEIETYNYQKQFQVPFSQFLEDFENQATKSFLQQNNGSMAPIPAFSENVGTETNIPPFNDFSFLKLKSGTLNLKLTNGLFFGLQNLEAVIFDNTYNQAVGTFQFSSLAAGTTKTATLDLKGKTISNDIKVIVNSIQSAGTGGQNVLIDLAKSVSFDVEISDITVESGKLSLEPGLLSDGNFIFSFNTTNDEKLHNIQMNDARFEYSISSDFAAGFDLELTFPDILKNNQPLVQTISVPAAGQATGALDFSNTVWKLDQVAANPYNRFQGSYKVILPSATGQISFSAEDQLSLNFSVSEMDIKDITGNFGTREHQLDESVLELGFDLSRYSSASTPIFFDNPQMRIEVSNSFGIPLKATFNATATGKNNEEALLNPPNFIIGSPSLAQKGQSVESVMVVNKNNSNLVGLLSIYPSVFNYSGSVTLNPANQAATTNFITSASKLTAAAEFDLPFRFKVQELVFRDTGEALSLGLDEGLTIDDIKEAKLKIGYKNGFPLKTTVRVIAIAADGTETIVVDDLSLESATPDAAGKVKEAGIAAGELFVTLTKDQLRQLDNATKNVYEIRCQTFNGGQTPVSMYTDYKVSMNMGMTVSFE